MKTFAPLDREQQAVYNLLVKASDGGGRFCQAEIVVTLEDVNDNAPVFSSESYTVSVFENTANKTLLTRVQATDSDAGIIKSIGTKLPVSILHSPQRIRIFHWFITRCTLL